MVPTGVCCSNVAGLMSSNSVVYRDTDWRLPKTREWAYGTSMIPANHFTFDYNSKVPSGGDGERDPTLVFPCHRSPSSIPCSALEVPGQQVTSIAGRSSPMVQGYLPAGSPG